jgi:predicted PhzF superfamily epimerase YddE/YHI9
VPLCGHATLASAVTLFNYVHPEAKELHFQTRWRGELVAYRESEVGQGLRVGLSLPISEITEEKTAEVISAVLAAGGLAESDLVRVATFDFGGPSPIVQLRADIDLANLKFDEAKLVSAPRLG